jgi:hypothetical protein
MLRRELRADSLMWRHLCVVLRRSASLADLAGGPMRPRAPKTGTKQARQAPPKWRRTGESELGQEKGREDDEAAAKPFARPTYRNTIRTVNNSPRPIRYNNWKPDAD